jgi:hypothetical protein
MPTLDLKQVEDAATPKLPTLPERIAELGITIKNSRVHENPNMAAGDMPAGSSHWSCVLSYGGSNRPTNSHEHLADDGVFEFVEPRHLSTWFSCGPAALLKHQRPKNPVQEYENTAALKRGPTAEMVLSCLLLDASGFENARSFEEWAEECGYDPDSRKAQAIYDTIAREVPKLKEFLGEHFEAFMYETEPY